MARQSSKTKSTKSAGKGKLAGKRVAFAGKFGYGILERAKKLAAAEGGQVVDAAKDVPDLIVAGDGQGGNPPALIAKVQKKYPAVQVLDLSDFWALLVPTREEYLALLTSGLRDYEQWSALRDLLWQAGATVDLSDADLRKLDLTHANLQSVNLTGADFRETNLSNVAFGNVERAKFDGATMNNVMLSHAENCSFRNANLASAHINPAQYTDCDFTGATLTEVFGGHTQAHDCKFDKADLSRADLEQSKFELCTFVRAKLTETRLAKCDFRGADLSGADLTGADLTSAILAGANLAGTRLCGACLLNADLTDANVDKADFTDANVIGAGLKGVDLAKAKGLAQPTARRKAGPNMKELEKQAGNAQRLEITTICDIPGGHITLQVGGGRWGSHSYVTTEKGGSSVGVPGPYQVPFSDCMLYFGQRYPDAQMRLDSIKVKVQKGTIGSKELKNLALAAWCEAFGQEIPAADDLKAQQKAKKQGNAALRDELLAELREGSKGVKKWNARKPEDRQAGGDFRRVDFSGAKLAGVQFDQIDLREAKFDGANLAGANLTETPVEGASFQNANLKKAFLAGKQGSYANFTGADASGANLRARNWKHACFKDANLSGANFSYASVCGADFSGTNLDGTVFNQTRFDETTIFPKGFELDAALTWVGKGTDPRIPKPADLKTKGPLDLDLFLKRLVENTEAAKLEKALSMLKADRFKLYAQVEQDSVVGVVKSQSDAELVYSCRIAADGSFACCTQNLNVCGGLRGSLCKHLLVLIVGLANGNELDLAEMDSWVAGTRARKPALDKDVMSATFLRYKGAEAGEVDWRPTETIPEDYYAM